MATAFDTLELKRSMVLACIARQESLVNDFKNRIQNILSNVGLGNEEEYDNNDLSQKSQASDEIDHLNEELTLANEEMAVLKNLTASMPFKLTVASLGAVVVTNLDTFFIAVSTEQFEVNGNKFFGISVKSPLYASMKGKTKGDQFVCRGAIYQILDVF